MVSATVGSLLAPLTGDDLSDVPQVDHFSLGLPLLILVAVLNEDGMGGTVGALHLHIPAALVENHSCPAADRALFQHDFFFHSI